MSKQATGNSKSASNQLDKFSNEMQQLAQFALDPTVSRTTEHPCINCGSVNIAYFINPLEQPSEDMSLYFACVTCNYVWKASTEEDI